MKSQFAAFFFVFAPLALAAHTPPEPPKLSDGSEKRGSSEEDEGARKKARLTNRFEVRGDVPEELRAPVLAFAIAAADGDLSTIENLLRNGGDAFLGYALDDSVYDRTVLDNSASRIALRSPLDIAAAEGHLPILSALLKYAARYPKMIDTDVLVRAAQNGKTDSIRLLLEFAAQKPDLRERFFGNPRDWEGVVPRIAYENAFKSLQTILDFLEQHPELVESLLPDGGATPFWAIDVGPSEECMRLLLEFIVRNPHLAPRFFGTTLNDDTRLFGTFARYRETYAIRLFLEYAARSEALAQQIFAAADGITALSDLYHTDAHGESTIDVLRLLLESPFRDRILGDLTELENGNNVGIAREIELWTVILEYIPRAAGTHPRYGQVGVFEAAVMARDIARVHTFLVDGREFNPMLLAAMLTHHENFDRSAFARFLNELTQLRETLIRPSMLARGGELFRRILANPAAANFDVDPQPIPPEVRALDNIVQILRPRIVANLQTLALDVLGGAIRNMGLYGRPGQFANEEQAANTVAHMHNINLPLPTDRYLPGARRHTANLRAFLLSIFVGSFANRLP